MNWSVNAGTGSSNKKYSAAQTASARLIMGDSLPDSTVNIIAAAYAKSSWSKLNSAMNCVISYATFSNVVVSFPMSTDFLLNFASWAHHTRKLKANTINSYVSSIATIHKLRNVDDSNCHNFLTKTLINGVRNLEMYDTKPKSTRKVMSLPLLTILGNEIALTDWSESSKQIIWAAATTAFFGSLRFGEILAQNKFSFCPEDTLLWSDVKMLNEDSFLLHIKTTKSKAKEGEFVDIFKFEGFGACPVAALLQLKKLTYQQDSDPVFKFPEGHYLTLATMNIVIRSLLYPRIGPAAFDIACHSFRGAIPSAIGKCPEIGGETESKGWGRWTSSAYLLYSRLKYDQKRAIFSKIATILELQGGRPSSLQQS